MCENLPTDDEGDCLLSTPFDEVTWSGVTKDFVTSIGNVVTPEAWVTIRTKAIGFAKFSNRRAQTEDEPRSMQRSNNRGHSNLCEDSDSEDDQGTSNDEKAAEAIGNAIIEVGESNETLGITQGKESKSDADDDSSSTSSSSTSTSSASTSSASTATS